jgi:hypothetical protein
VGERSRPVSYVQRHGSLTSGHVHRKARGVVGDSDPSAPEIYKSAKATFERLERAAASHAEWLRFSHEVLEAVMRCQAIVMENQRATLDARSSGLAEDREHRIAARDTLEIVDRLTALYQRAKAKLAGR